jgi:hypothetical protein
MAAFGSIGKSPVRIPGLKFLFVTFASLLLVSAIFSQAVPYARQFSKPPEEVQAALKDLQAYSGQKLPTLDGFVAVGDKPLDRFERAFYQFSIDILPGTNGATVVRVTAKITAWYADRDPAKSGYQVLASNGRLELDLLDRLGEKFGGKQPASSMARALTNSTISAPKPKLDLGDVSGLSPSTATDPTTKPEVPADELSSMRASREVDEKRMKELSSELQGLQEIQKNQAHPQNLVVVKKSGTPVLAKPVEGAHVLFNAAATDEFEFLGAEGDWIHVQISGPSRGYIHRNDLELSEHISEELKASGVSTEKPAAFRVVREENRVFPGNWEPLKGKTVKLFTVQPVSQDPKETDARAKNAFARSIFQKSLQESSASASSYEGVVVIFDSADGGIVGTTVEALKQLSAGMLSPETFWKQCYLDPLEAFQEAHKPSAK